MSDGARRCKGEPEGVEGNKPIDGTTSAILKVSEETDLEISGHYGESHGTKS